MEPDANTKLPLFVYGSLIDPIHRAEVLGHFADGVPAILHGYARGRSLHWYIRPRAGAQTGGLVLIDLDARDFATLDAYEDVPTLYTREQIEVTGIDSALIRCWVYLPTAWAGPDAG
jgi:cation transport regulator ChaC